MYPKIAREFRVELIKERFIVKLLISFSDLLPLTRISSSSQNFNYLLLIRSPTYKSIKDDNNMKMTYITLNTEISKKKTELKTLEGFFEFLAVFSWRRNNFRYSQCGHFFLLFLIDHINSYLLGSFNS